MRHSRSSLDPNNDKRAPAAPGEAAPATDQVESFAKWLVGHGKRITFTLVAGILVTLAVSVVVMHPGTGVAMIAAKRSASMAQCLVIFIAFLH